MPRKFEVTDATGMSINLLEQFILGIKEESKQKWGKKLLKIVKSSFENLSPEQTEFIEEFSNKGYVSGSDRDHFVTLMSPQKPSHHLTDVDILPNPHQYPMLRRKEFREYIERLSTEMLLFHEEKVKEMKDLKSMFRTMEKLYHKEENRKAKRILRNMIEINFSRQEKLVKVINRLKDIYEETVDESDSTTSAGLNDKESEFNLIKQTEERAKMLFEEDLMEGNSMLDLIGFSNKATPRKKTVAWVGGYSLKRSSNKNRTSRRCRSQKTRRR